jgi:hypothetical protein
MAGADQILARATAAKTGSTTTAVISGTLTTIQVARDLTVAAGDMLLVIRVGASWFATSRHYATAPADQPDTQAPPDPKPATVTGRLVIPPVETRSYRSGGWRTDTTDVYQGAYGGNGNHTGAVFYGGKPRSLAGATVTQAGIRVRRESGGAYAARATTMRLMTNSTRPGGAPSLGSSTSGPSLKVGQTTQGFTIPDSWAQAMVDGSAGGLAFYQADGSPYVIFAGRGTWSPAFTLTIAWKRNT